MSGRQFKSQASSSRAALGSGGLGGFGSSTTSVLSYLTPPPDLSKISDPNVVVTFKGLSKKDPTTKSKALEDLRSFLRSPPESQHEIGAPILDAWVS
jgi:E3 ubiquitin-protein ligase listerin